MQTERLRMTAEERREAIVRAVIPVFAEKGFHGATTKELAEASNVSEALLYKHFPSKEDLFTAISANHFDDEDAHPEYDALLAMPPSTQRLALSIRYLIRHMADLKQTAMARMVGHSLLGDGAFAKAVFRQTQRSIFEFLTESFEAAAAAGDIDAPTRRPDLLWWMTQHLGFGLKLTGLPGARTMSYGARRDDVVDLAVEFCLRGIGLSGSAIAKYCGQQDLNRPKK